jgi:transcriptional regulator with XRE-family HTH domain
MAGIREVLAANLKEYRRRCGFSQDKLAEQADISSQYLATVETCRKFPTPEVLDRLAAAFGIETHLLFAAPPSPELALERLHKEVVADIKAVLADIERTVGVSVKKAIADEYKAKNKR